MPDAKSQENLDMTVFLGRLSKHLERLAKAAEVLDDASAQDSLNVPSSKAITTLQNTDYLRQALRDLVIVSSQLSTVDTLGAVSIEQGREIATALSLDEIRRLLAPIGLAQGVTDGDVVGAGDLELF